MIGLTVSRAAEQARRLLGAPLPMWRPPHDWRRLSSAQGQEWIARLRRDGLVLWPRFLDAEQVWRIQAALTEQIGPPPAPGMEFRDDQQYFACLQPLGICPEIAEAALDPDLLNLVSGYLRRHPFLSEADFRRVLPLDLAEHERRNAKFAKGHSSSHWHHDLHGREIKVMVYLTDVAEEDQNFAYCLGSHRGFRTTNYEKSRFTEDQVQALGRTVLECRGRAGTAVVFDTNGIHRLRRRKTRLRDSVTFNYHPGRLCRWVAQSVHPAALNTRRQEFERLLVIV